MVGGLLSHPASLMISRPLVGESSERRGISETDQPGLSDGEEDGSRLRSLFEAMTLQSTSPDLAAEESTLQSRAFGASFLPKEQPYQRGRSLGSFLERRDKSDKSLFSSDDATRLRGIFLDDEPSVRKQGRRTARGDLDEDFPDTAPSAAIRSVSSPGATQIVGSPPSLSGSKTSSTSSRLESVPYSRQHSLPQQQNFTGSSAPRPSRLSRSTSSVERGGPGYAQQHDEKYKTELCKKFSKLGSCRYAQKCQFAHGEDELRNLPRHRKYKTEMCKNLLAKGHCPYGTRCRFLHDDDQLNEATQQCGNSIEWSPTKSPRSGTSEPDSVRSSPSKSPEGRDTRLIRFPELAGIGKVLATTASENGAWSSKPDSQRHRSVSFGQTGDDEQSGKRNTPPGCWMQQGELNDDWSLDVNDQAASSGSHVIAPKYPRDYALTPDSSSIPDKGFWNGSEALGSLRAHMLKKATHATRSRSTGVAGERGDHEILQRVPPPPVGSRSYSYSSRSSNRSSYVGRASDDIRSRTTSMDNVVSSWSSISSVGSLSTSGLLSTSAPVAGETPLNDIIHRRSNVSFADQRIFRFAESAPSESASELERGLERAKDDFRSSPVREKCVNIPRSQTVGGYEYQHETAQVKLPFYPSLDLRSKSLSDDGGTTPRLKAGLVE